MSRSSRAVVILVSPNTSTHSLKLRLVMDTDWRGELDEWLAPFVGALQHKTRSRMCPAYIAGLIGPGDRKSIQPMAARDSDVSYDRLHHFIASGVWDVAGAAGSLLELMGDDVGGDEEEDDDEDED